MRRLKADATRRALLKFPVAISFDIPNTQGFTKRLTADWLKQVASDEGGSISRLNYKSFNRTEMISLNKQFLNHDYDTDIITFSEVEAPNPVVADFALGWDQIKLQSAELNEPFLRELHRIIVHGLLHCLGYDDQSSADQMVIREKEDFYLNQHPDCSTWNK